MSLAKVLDLRKKPEGEYARDTRIEMNEEDGNRSSVEESVVEAEMKSDDSPAKEEKESKTESKAKAGRKARATSKIAKDKQLALEETLGEEKRDKAKIKETPPNRKARGGKGRQTTTEEVVAD